MKQSKQKNNPKWAVASSKYNDNIECLLNFAQNHYSVHIECFLKHKDMGLKSLAVIFTGEITIISFCLANKFPVITAIIALIIFALLSILFSWYGVVNCKQSYKAALENALLCTKALWALGLASPLEVKKNQNDFSDCPVPNDTTPYVPRYLQDAQKHDTTDKFVNFYINKPGTTFFNAKWTIVFFGTVGVIVGILGAYLIFKNIS